MYCDLFESPVYVGRYFIYGKTVVSDWRRVELLRLGFILVIEVARRVAPNVGVYRKQSVALCGYGVGVGGADGIGGSNGTLAVH